MGFIRTFTYKCIMFSVCISSTPDYSSFSCIPLQFYFLILHLHLCHKYIHNFTDLYVVKDPELRKIHNIWLSDSELTHPKLKNPIECILPANNTITFIFIAEHNFIPYINQFLLWITVRTEVSFKTSLL